jgi:transposase
MKNVEEWFMIRDLARQGLSISEIAGRIGCDRKTVRKHLVHPEQPRYKARPPRLSKLDPFKSRLDQRLERGVFNCEVLYRELCEQGYDGKKTILRDYVQPYRLAARHQASVRFETPPGQQGQVDWGSFGTLWHQGRQRRLYCFAFTLGYSRAMYAEFTVSSAMMDFLRCHINAFSYLGGVPEHLLHDNQKTVVHVHDPGGAHHWNTQYLDFADHYGFWPRLCRPYRAQTKGKVESGVKYIRGNFWPSCPDVATLEALNEALWSWLSGVANVRLHGTTYEVPMARLAWEKESLGSLQVPPYDLSIVSSRRSSKDSFISYGGNRYSVPAAYALSPLSVREKPEGILEIYAGLDCIARHALVAGRHQSVVDPSHLEPLWQALKSRSADVPRPAVGPRLGPGVSEPHVEVRSLDLYEALAKGEAR